ERSPPGALADPRGRRAHSPRRASASLRLWPFDKLTAPPPRVVFGPTVQSQLGPRNCGVPATSASGSSGSVRTLDPRSRVRAQHAVALRITGSQCRFLPSRWPLVQRQDTRLWTRPPAWGAVVVVLACGR